jgi:hypothetical protein
MSLIKEHYQDENGNWLPEAQEILAKATVTTTSNGTHMLLPLTEVEDVFTKPLTRAEREETKKVETP